MMTVCLNPHFCCAPGWARPAATKMCRCVCVEGYCDGVQMSVVDKRARLLSKFLSDCSQSVWRSNKTKPLISCTIFSVLFTKSKFNAHFVNKHEPAKSHLIIALVLTKQANKDMHQSHKPNVFYVETRIATENIFCLLQQIWTDVSSPLIR